MTKLALKDRDRMPEALRVLLETFPRDDWEAHPHFAGLVQFWLDRHLMFRRLLGNLEADAEAAIDRKIDPQAHKARISRYGGMLVSQLHGHHQIEDDHYFPVLGKMEPKLLKGFDILDKDHHALDGLLDRFTSSANAVLQGPGKPGPFHKELLSFGAMLHRHLEDEEDLIVPVILKHGPDALH
ncbi:hemerythrin domain-containing protein [Puniceibacterium sediminis]|uniref:Hemerythrin HHE cation binding domain-containing protein n=1 Tax=Puniceibacterium sediminis TaxID=1608407 RepID=A0A238ZEH9_9RHOB|nr:hemerythrin domain-containing protein [Puniceibacterium sediminis]SNR81757.1 Hemerythrin HHE cation binding domain-containing protein [Puniceibacterium sediminis]